MFWPQRRKHNISFACLGLLVITTQSYAQDYRQDTSGRQSSSQRQDTSGRQSSSQRQDTSGRQSSSQRQDTSSRQSSSQRQDTSGRQSSSQTQDTQINPYNNEQLYSIDHYSANYGTTFKFCYTYIKGNKFEIFGEDSYSTTHNIWSKQSDNNEVTLIQMFNVAKDLIDTGICLEMFEIPEVN